MSDVSTVDVLEHIDEQLKAHHAESYAVSLERAKAVWDLPDSVDGEHVQRCPDEAQQEYYEAQAEWIETGLWPVTYQPFEAHFRQSIIDNLYQRNPIIERLLERGRTVEQRPVSAGMFQINMTPPRRTIERSVQEGRTLGQILAVRQQEINRIIQECRTIRNNSGVPLSPQERDGLAPAPRNWRIIDITES